MKPVDLAGRTGASDPKGSFDVPPNNFEAEMRTARRSKPFTNMRNGPGVQYLLHCGVDKRLFHDAVTKVSRVTLTC